MLLIFKLYCIFVSCVMLNVFPMLYGCRNMYPILLILITHNYPSSVYLSICRSGFIFMIFSLSVYPSVSIYQSNLFLSVCHCLSISACLLARLYTFQKLVKRSKGNFEEGWGLGQGGVDYILGEIQMLMEVCVLLSSESSK